MLKNDNLFDDKLSLDLSRIIIRIYKKYGFLNTLGLINYHMHVLKMSFYEEMEK